MHPPAFNERKTTEGCRQLHQYRLTEHCRFLSVTSHQEQQPPLSRRYLSARTWVVDGLLFLTSSTPNGSIPRTCFTNGVRLPFVVDGTLFQRFRDIMLRDTFSRATEISIVLPWAGRYSYLFASRWSRTRQHWQYYLRQCERWQRTRWPEKRESAWLQSLG